jgi:hypothetical protein
MGAGLRPIEKSMESSPDPTMLRAPYFYPNHQSSPIFRSRGRLGVPSGFAKNGDAHYRIRTSRWGEDLTRLGRIYRFATLSPLGTVDLIASGFCTRAPLASPIFIIATSDFLLIMTRPGSYILPCLSHVFCNKVTEVNLPSEFTIHRKRQPDMNAP